jgi:hypothetical protein
MTSAIVNDAILRRDFQSFLRRNLMTLNPGAPFLPNWHIDAIAYKLELVRRGEITRLIINMPPLLATAVSAGLLHFREGLIPFVIAVLLDRII